MKDSSESACIVVVGGSNIGTQFTCKYASSGYNVNVYTINRNGMMAH